MTNKTLTPEDFEDDAKRIGCSVAAVRAVAEVESAGGGFCPDGFPKILFEGHQFHRYTKGKFTKSNPTISYPTFTRVHYGKTWQLERARFNVAVALDRNAALMSTSWGMFQVMGFNFAVCGFKTVQSFVNTMMKNENGQLEAFTSYVINSDIGDELARLDWDGFARYYNGPLYKKNDYAGKMSRAHTKWSKKLG